MPKLKQLAYVYRQLLILVSLMIIAPVLQAEENSDPNTLVEVYEYSGIDAHLTWLKPTVLSEYNSRRSQICENQESLPDLFDDIENILSAETLRTLFLKEMGERLSFSQREQVIDWANSDAGISIRNAEIESGKISELQYQKSLNEYASSAENNEIRSQRIASMLEGSGAAFFVSAINTATTNLVSMASVCSSSVDIIAKAESEIAKSNGEEALYRAFMRDSMILPASVFYQNVSDDHIDEYIAFAKSEAGSAYFKSLINGMRAVHENRINALKTALKK